MKRKIKFLIIGLCFIFIVLCSNANAASLSSNVINFKKLAQDVIKEGVGENIGQEILDGGYFTSKIFEYDAEDFRNKFSKNYHFNWYRNSKSSLYQSDDPFVQKIQDMFIRIVAEMEKTNSMKFLFEQAAKDTGIQDDEYSRSAIERVAIEVMLKKIDEVIKAYRKGCSDEVVGKFTYKGNEYKCKEIANEFTYEFGPKVYAYEYFKNYISLLIQEIDRHLQHNGQIISDTYVNNLYEFINGKKPTDNDVPPGEDDGNGAFDDDRNFGEFIFKPFSFSEITNPNILKVISYAKKFKNVGEANISESFISTINDFVNNFSLIGIIIMFAAIMLLGVRMIWNHVDGLTAFKESLPYLLVAIIFFWCAPGLVDVVKNSIDISDVKVSINSIWGTILYIIRVLAFAGIIFNGVKLMFGNAGKKASAKSKLIAILIGCILVFASSFVVEIIKDTFETGISNTDKIEEKEN